MLYSLFEYLNNNYDFPIFKHIEIEANNSSYNLSDFVINK